LWGLPVGTELVRPLRGMAAGPLRLGSLHLAGWCEQTARLRLVGISGAPERPYEWFEQILFSGLVESTLTVFVDSISTYHGTRSARGMLFEHDFVKSVVDGGKKVKVEHKKLKVATHSSGELMTQDIQRVVVAQPVMLHWRRMANTGVPCCRRLWGAPCSC
jgi:hypothetical protein